MEKLHPADKAAKERLKRERAAYEKNKTAEILLVACVLLLLFGVPVLHAVLPDADYSKRENKTLTQFSELSLSDLFRKDENGQKKLDLEGYLRAQFPFRDQFMALDGARKALLSLGQSNGITLTPEGYLLPEEEAYAKEPPLNFTLLQNTVKAYEQSPCYSGKYDTVFALAGKKSRFVSILPPDFPTDLLKENGKRNSALLKDSGFKTVDLTEVLLQHRTEELYYRTDHHWTSLGAYYGSAAILAEYGLEIAPLSSYDRQTATKSFKGTAYNSSGLYFLPGDEMTFFRYEGDEDYTVSLCNPAGKVTSSRMGFYDLSALEKDHKGTDYDAFVAGVSTPVVRITGQGADRPTLLVIKDSFAHSALPFLAQQFDLITVDLRAKNFSLPAMLEEGEIDGILVLVSEETLWS
jgi:hypothetical protein